MASSIVPIMTGERLEAALLSAHALDDRDALVALYLKAADLAKGIQDTERECFFLTHAWIFALETDHVLRNVLRDRLAQHGRV